MDNFLEKEPSVEATFFLYTGSSTQRDIRRAPVTRINKEDADFINENKLLLSLEELRDCNFALYLRSPDMKEDDETMVLSFGRTCEDTIKELVELFKKKQDKLKGNAQ